MALTKNEIPYTQSVKSSVVSATTGKTTYAGAPDANTHLLLTAGADGGLVYELKAIPTATLSAAIKLVLYISKDGGATIVKIDSEVAALYTMANTTATPETFFANISPATPLRLSANDRLYVSISSTVSGGQINFHAQHEDF